VEQGQAIRTGITASAIAHLSVLALVVLFSEVHPFGSVTAEPIAVDIVTPQEVAENQEVAEKKPEPPTPLPDFSVLEKPAASSPPAPAAQQPAASKPQQQAALPASRPGQQQATAQPQSTAQPQAQSTPPLPAYTPPEPDISIKYHVLLGLPQDLSQSPPLASSPARSGDKPGDNFDAPATKAADVASNLVAEFRRHLKTCSKLPASMTAADDIKVKLRVFMTPEGKLATEPVLIEASASMKGPLLMQSAVSALQACQPYAMLPADRYGEWKVLDLSFTPRDF
jgi:hypothetical protein